MDTNQQPLLKLDRTPTYEEEVRAFGHEAAYKGTRPFNEDRAKGRIDSIARWLAIVWSAFLIFIIFAQGIGTGFAVRWATDDGSEWHVPLLPVFHLESADFIAVVTTTTAAVFGFLVIVTNHLFFKRDKKD
ncbi:hypothetical protein [uncultured Agrobacterium sp.]|uniref:hypothetical protein n=1 Tax=uncultured Agrobacterium sp. TaxID=157277 RepID=UPI0025F00BD6|nr:hypothetical protein [uncultured Agrobacterium sp.]